MKFSMVSLFIHFSFLKIAREHFNNIQSDRNENSSNMCVQSLHKQTMRISQNYQQNDDECMPIPAFILKKPVLTKRNYDKLILFVDKIISNLETNAKTPYYPHCVEIIKNNQHCGLSNFNGHCFINSVLQILFSSKYFTETLNLFSKKSSFCKNLFDLFQLMKNKRIINQLRIYLRLQLENEIEFDIFKKTGKISDVIISICSIFAKENINIFDIEATSNVFYRYPILKMLKQTQIQKRLDLISNRMCNIQHNKIIIICGAINNNFQMIPLGPNGKCISIQNKIYDLIGVVEKIDKPFCHMQSYAKRSNIWYKFNDECVTISSLEYVLNKILPYFAFYEEKQTF